MKNFFLVRPSKKPMERLPFGVRSMGRRVQRGESETFKPRIDWVAIHWCLEGEGCYRLSHTDELVPQGQMIIHLPGDSFSRRILSPRWEGRWVTIDGPFAQPMVRHLRLPVRSSFAAEFPTRPFEDLMRAMGKGMAKDEMAASKLAYEILIGLAQSASLKTASAERAGGCWWETSMQVINDHFREADFDVNALAESLGIHRVHLSRTFKRLTGLPPSEYIQKCRLQHALSLLERGDMSIGRVARASGFRSASYFSRFVRGRVGRSPEELRARG